MDNKNCAPASPAADNKNASSTTTARRGTRGGKKKQVSDVNDENQPLRNKEKAMAPTSVVVSENKVTILGRRVGRARRSKKQVNYNDNGGDTEPESSDEDDDDDDSVVEAKDSRGKKRGGAATTGAKEKRTGKSPRPEEPKKKKQKFLPSPPVNLANDNHVSRAIVGRDVPSPKDDWRCFGVLDY